MLQSSSKTGKHRGDALWTSEYQPELRFRRRWLLSRNKRLRIYRRDSEVRALYGNALADMLLAEVDPARRSRASSDGQWESIDTFLRKAMQGAMPEVEEVGR